MLGNIKLAWEHAGVALHDALWQEKFEIEDHPIKPTRIGYFILEVIGLTYLFVMEKVVCWWHGHDLLKVHSYAGPDRGFEAHACTRCGWGFRHVYY